MWLCCRPVAAADLIIAPTPDTVIPFIVPVLAPGVQCAAISDAANLLAFGHKGGTEPQVTLIRLDAEGKPMEGPPTPVPLPKPAGLAAKPHSALWLTFHPRYPLLYIWQDVEGPKEGEAPLPAYDEFDHLLIYAVDGPTPQLLVALARGTLFSCGNVAGAIALNPAASRLYVPNFFEKKGTAVFGGLGYFLLDPAGLPRLELAPDAPPAPAAETVPPDAAAAIAARAPTLAAIQQVQATGKLPAYQKRYTMVSGWGPPMGAGFYPATENVVLFGGPSGAMSWDIEDRRNRINAVYTTPVVAFRYRLTGHPSIPCVYTSMVNYPGYVIRNQIAEGYLTLRPDFAYITHYIHSPPVVLAKRKQVAVGGAGRVHLLNVDDRGAFKQEMLQAVVQNPTVNALAYSEKFDKLYVPTEKSP